MNKPHPKKGQEFNASLPGHTFNEPRSKLDADKSQTSKVLPAPKEKRATKSTVNVTVKDPLLSLPVIRNFFYKAKFLDELK